MANCRVACACGRNMYPDALQGAGAFRCGCGVRVRVSLTSSREGAQCVFVDAGARCRLLAVEREPVPVCEDHSVLLRKRFVAINLSQQLLTASEADQVIAAWLDLTMDGGIDCAAYVQSAAAKRERAERVKQVRQVRAEISLVYYMRFADRVKIGTTTNLRKRQGAVPHDEIMAVEPGGREVEEKRHLQFAHLWLTGEWFRLDRDLRKHIRYLQEHPLPERRMPARRAAGPGYLTGHAAARLLGVSPATVYSWVTKGYLAPATADHRREPVYAVPDLLFAEELARIATLRTSGTMRNVRRVPAAPGVGTTG